jgi:hypothetical protein
MTFAELLLLVAGGTGLYVLLRPLQRAIETYLVRKFVARHPRPRRPWIDVADLTSRESHRKEDDRT